MDRKNGAATRNHQAGPGPTTSTRRKLPVKTNIPALQSQQQQQQPQPQPAVQQETKMGKISCTAKMENAMQQQQQPTFASVHRPRQISSTMAAIKRTGSGSRADLQRHYQNHQLLPHHFQQQQQFLQQQHQQQLQQKYGHLVLLRQDGSSGGGGGTSSSVATTALGRVDPNNAGIFNQPMLLPLPVQIPDPFANAAAAAAAIASRQPAELPVQQVSSEKADYLQQHQQNNAKTGVNQKHSTATTMVQASSRLPKQQLPLPTGQNGSKMAPKLLTDIYERHLLSQTVFDGENTPAPAKETHRRSSTTQKPQPLTTAKLMPKDSVGDNLYESIRGNYHIYEKIPDSGPAPSRRGSRLEQYVRPPPPLQPRPKSLPVGVSIRETCAATTTVAPIPYKLTSPDVLRAMKSPIAANLSPIAEKPGRGGAALVPVYGGGASGGSGHNNKSATVTADRINIALETAKAFATAAYIERAAQRLASGSVILNQQQQSQQQQQQHQQQLQQHSNNHNNNNNSKMSGSEATVGGFCGAIQRTPPPVPAGLARRMANREFGGLGKVKVMLRVSDDPPKPPSTTQSGQEEPTPTPPTPTPTSYLTVDKKKRQVTLCEPQTGLAAAVAAAAGNATSVTQERGPMVSAPKMFAFDALFTTEDSQHDICGSALSEVIPAVLEGSDGCLLSLGYPGAGQSRTMFGTPLPPADLGAIPCAIAWLYKGINEKRQKSGARFSVRVSALGVNATKPGSSSRDLLAGHATESDDSPGMYLRDDFLGRPTELRAPTAERAALFLDLALSGRAQGSSGSFEPALIYTLHVYQYSLSGKRGVEGGRSRLHLIDLGGCANRTGGLPLSGIGNVLLAILSGQKHPPNRDHPLTPLLRDCLAPLTCHVAIVAHVAHSQTHTDTLTTIQLASRIHRLRRRKPRHHLLVDRAAGLAAGSSGHQSGGSSEGPDPSSSDFSQDTVIYVGPCDDPTDGEHPPVYLPSLNSGDQRCAMNKALKGSVAEKPNPSPQKKKASTTSTLASTSKGAQSSVPAPIPLTRTDSLKRNQSASAGGQQEMVASAIQIAAQHASPKIVAGAFKHVVGVSKGSNIPTPKGSPMRRPAAAGAASASGANRESPSRQVGEEKWIDGPRMSKSKVHEARHFLREINHVKNHETWIDGPKTANATQVFLPPAAHSNQSYGFMDNHKKTMIRQWVENQSIQLMQSVSANNSPAHSRHQSYNPPRFRPSKSDEDGFVLELERQEDLVNPIAFRGFTATSGVVNSSESHVRTGLKQAYSLDNPETQPTYATVNPRPAPEPAPAAPQQPATDNQSEKSHPASEKPATSSKHDSQEEEDQDSGPSEVPPALPLMDPLGSREISHESIHHLCSRHGSSVHSSQHSNLGMMDCGLQVTEDDIARTMMMGGGVGAFGGVGAIGGEHPLSALSHGDVSVVSSSFNAAAAAAGGDAFSDCVIGESMRNQFDQLARLREIFTSQLAMAEVTPVAFRLGDAGSVYSEPAYRLNTGPASVCSEPAYRPPSPRCRDCRQSLSLSRTPSQSSLPSLTGIVAIAGMEQYASLRHPDGASDPNIPKLELDESSGLLLDPEEHIRENPLAELDDHEQSHLLKASGGSLLPQQTLPTLPLLPLSTPEAYDSGHDSTPRTSKHSGISRRAESGYHSVGTVRDSDESSFGSAASRAVQKSKKNRNRTDKSLCHWLRNPFNCTYPDTEGDVSDF